MENTIRRQFKSRMDAKQDVWRAIPALMGDGNGTIEVPNQQNMVYIRVGDGDLGQAFNNRCQLRDNLAVYVGYDPITDPDRRIFQVLSVRMADYAGAGNVTVPNVGPHHTTHEFGGGDDVYIEWRRLMGLRVGRPAAFVVTVDPGYIYRAGWIAIPSTNVNLTATHAALIGVQAQYVLISLSSIGVVTATAGTVVLSPALLTIADVPTPPAGHIPLAAVRLYKLQTAIGDTPAAPDIIDLRFPTYNTTSAYVTPHNILSASHGDSLAGAVVDGDIIIGNVTPAWSRLAISIPAAGTLNYLGVNNGELRPSWKSGSSNPGAAATILASDASGYLTLAKITTSLAHFGDAATNYANFASDGELTLIGTARIEREFAVSLSGFATGASKPVETILGNYLGYTFSINDLGYFAFETPSDWDSSSDLEIAIHWYIDEAYALQSAEVRWALIWTACKEDASEAVDGATTTTNSADVNIPATAKYLTETLIAIPHASVEQHDMIGFQVKRVALVDGTNPTAKPVVVSIECEYIANRLGLAT